MQPKTGVCIKGIPLSTTKTTTWVETSRQKFTIVLHLSIFKSQYSDAVQGLGGVGMVMARNILLGGRSSWDARPLQYKHLQIHTRFKDTSYPHCMPLGCGRKPEYLEGEQANSMRNPGGLK